MTAPPLHMMMKLRQGHLKCGYAPGPRARSRCPNKAIGVLFTYDASPRCFAHLQWHCRLWRSQYPLAALIERPIRLWTNDFSVLIVPPRFELPPGWP
jgi:hypothetical protein